MKRVSWLLALTIILAGCSGENDPLDRALSFRDRLLSGNGCSFQAEITADYGDSLYTFSMDCSADTAGKLDFTVTAPETISGIAGTIDDTGGTISFEDTALHFDLLADEQLTPVSAPWVLVRTLRSGCITTACMEEDLLHITADDSYDDDALTLDIWLDADDHPVRAEVLYDGKRILSLNVENFAVL